MLPDLERADRIGEFWGYPQSRAFAELLIDCEENRRSGPFWSQVPVRSKRTSASAPLKVASELRAVLVGMLREAER
jgi:hypothetical protein